MFDGMVPELTRLILGFGIMYIRSSGDVRVQNFLLEEFRKTGHRSYVSRDFTIVHLRFRDPFLLFLSTAKDQKALSIDSAKPMLAHSS